MSPLLDDLSPFEDDDSVGGANRREPAGDDKVREQERDREALPFVSFRFEAR